MTEKLSEVLSWVMENKEAPEKHDDIFGYVAQVKNPKGDMRRYQVITKNNQNIIVESPFHYEMGDGIPLRDVWNNKCNECGTNMFLDEKNDEYYCPIGHD